MQRPIKKSRYVKKLLLDGKSTEEAHLPARNNSKDTHMQTNNTNWQITTIRIYICCRHAKLTDENKEILPAGADIKEVKQLLTDNAYLDHKPARKEDAILLTDIKQKNRTHNKLANISKKTNHIPTVHILYCMYFDTWKGWGG
jgi:hypothetical protein